VAVSQEAEALAKDLFSSLGRIDVRELRGDGDSRAGLYCDGVLFGLISDGQAIFLRAEGVVARALAAEGSEPYGNGAGAPVEFKGYWSLPDTSLVDPAEAALWASRSLELARANWHD
jgi:DNA transformation protein and related proteins